MEKWGVFTMKDGVDETVSIIESAGLEIFEKRELEEFEKLTYGYLLTDDIWIVMFYATKREFKKLIRKNKLTRVF